MSERIIDLLSAGSAYHVNGVCRALFSDLVLTSPKMLENTCCALGCQEQGENCLAHATTLPGV